MSALLAEAGKIPAFIRRDFLVAWSYRMSFVTDLLGLVGQALIFYFVSQLIDPSKLPTYGGTEVTYLEFAAVGMMLGAFIHFGMHNVASAVRNEQLQGTLESLLVTPTAPQTIQFGSVAFLFLYLPLRLAVLLGAIALAFGLNFELSGVLPAVVILLAFMPFVWGLGVAGAATIVTFRRGSGLIAMGALVVAFVSGLYFPIDLLPGWLTAVAQWNPIALAVEGMRESLLGGAQWGEIGLAVAVLLPMSLLALVIGFVTFRTALARERRLGTVGLY